MGITVDSAATSRRGWGTLVWLALLLAFGTAAWQHLVHAWGSVHGGSAADHLAHALRDGALAWPLALVAVVAGLSLSRSLRLPERGALGVVARGGVIAAGFAVLLIPGVVGHALVDAAVRGGASAILPAAESIASNLGRFLEHGVREALVGLLAAVPLACVALARGDRNFQGARAPERIPWAAGGAEAG